jgi:PAS domain S-box-containing protein
MYHHHLVRQIKKHLGENALNEDSMQHFFHSISDSYFNYERDRELSEHAFSINEMEYHSVNSALKKLTIELDQIVKDRTRELEDIAQFPLENPNPIIRVNLNGDIIFKNPSSSKLNKVTFEGKSFSLPQFFKNNIQIIADLSSFDLMVGDKQFIFYTKLVKQKNYVNFYGADVTEKNELKIRAQENFHRLRNFLETTDDAYYILYAHHSEKNFITSKWNYFFGFDLLHSKNMLIDKSASVNPLAPRQHFNEIKKLGIGEKLAIQYQVKNKATGEIFWLTEVLNKHYDIELDDIVISGRISDITKEIEFQQHLTVEKEKLELLTKNSPDIILLTDKSGKIEYISPTAKRILGYSEDQMVGKPFQHFLCKPCKQELNKVGWLKNIKSGKNTIEYRMVDHAGKEIWVESVASVIQEKGTNNWKILMHNRNIDAFKKAEFVLKESEQKYRGLFENMQLGVMEVDMEEKITWVNKSFELMTGYTLRFLKGKKAVEIFLSHMPAKKFMNKVMAERTNKVDSIYEIKMKKKKGDLIDVVISGSPIIDINGKVKGTVGIHWDVTEIRRLEKMIEEEKSIRQKEIMQATINGEEHQRSILGNELHDGVGHILTYTSLYLQMASDSPNHSPDLFKKANEKVEEALNEVRRISRSLVPPALTDLGLKEALVELFNQHSHINSIQFSINTNHTHFDDIDINAQRNIYRIVQELMNNTIKHAEAKKVNLHITRAKTKFIMQYFNDGKAFNTTKVKKGIGLQSITNRTYFYGGETQIESIPKIGTTFTIELPLKNILNHE